MSSGPILSEDPLHLIATYDPEEEGRPDTEMHRSLSRTISREDEDTSNARSPNVYIDELAGSDAVGNGTKQAPYQSIYGAYKQRGEDIHVFVKRRCIDTKTKYWIPADQGTHLDLQRFSTRDRAAEQEAHNKKVAEAQDAKARVKAEGGAVKPPASETTPAAPAPAAPKEKGGFLSKLKKAFK